jgi:DNA-binding MarR family transcriptional regulator
MSDKQDNAQSVFEKTSGTLDERIAAALAKLALAARHELRQRAADEGLSAVQAQVLTLLTREGSLEIGSLAVRLSLTPATVSDSVAALERHSLVQRHPVLKDRRCVRVVATPRGRGLGSSLALWPELFGQGIAQLSEAEKQIFYRVLNRMVLSLLERGVIQEARMCMTCVHFRPNVHEDPRRPHHCALVDVPLGLSTLRIDCPDHQGGRDPETAMEKLGFWLGTGA